MTDPSEERIVGVESTILIPAAGFGHGEPIARDASTCFRNKYGRNPEHTHQQRSAA